jgi:hypothetical protein
LSVLPPNLHTVCKMNTLFLWPGIGAGAARPQTHQHQRRVVFALLFLLATATTGFVIAGPNDPAYEENDLFFRAPDGEVVGTGAKRPNAEQWAWGEEHMLKATRVKLNALGLARVNRAKEERGQQQLDASEVDLAPLGAEAQATGTGTDVLAPGALPAYVDNSTLRYFPPIRSQGSLGSCAQFASVYYTMTYMTALARNWDAKSGGDTFRFSPKWTYNMLNGGQNVGSWHYDAYAIAQKHGLAEARTGNLGGLPLRRRLPRLVPERGGMAKRALRTRRPERQNHRDQR